MAGSRRVPMGRLGRPFGIKGEVRVRPYHPASENWASLRVLYVQGEPGEETVEVLRARPASVKGTYIKSASLSSTMSPGVNIALSELTALGK